MNARIILPLIAFLVVVATMACGADESYTPGQPQVEFIDSDDTTIEPTPQSQGELLGKLNPDSRRAARIYRWHDDELNVTCWGTRGSDNYSLFCIPDKDLQ